MEGYGTVPLLALSLMIAARRVQHRSRQPVRQLVLLVSGLTMTKAGRQSPQTSDSQAQRSRSADVSIGRFAERRRRPTWCRRARFSNWSAA
jgi:hypothetical protein